jgi:phosphatidylethanolamine-binding protein (PEBP) family uncharacterized protein
VAVVASRVLVLYGGPQPPPGDGVHRYFFYLYALREPSRLAAGCTADDLRHAVVGKELASEDDQLFFFNL